MSGASVGLATIWIGVWWSQSTLLMMPPSLSRYCIEGEDWGRDEKVVDLEMMKWEWIVCGRREPVAWLARGPSPVEAFVTGIKNLDRWKSSLITWSLRSEALDRLILWEFKGQNVATPAMYLRKCVDRFILFAQNLSWSLDRLLKGTLIAWFHFDPGGKCFYRWCLCDYPLYLVGSKLLAFLRSL